MSVAIVQEARKFNVTNTTSNLTTKAFASTTTAGNLLVCTIMAETAHHLVVTGVPVISPPTTPGLTWALARGGDTPAIFYSPLNEYLSSAVAIYYCQNAPSISNATVTTISASTTGAAQAFQLGCVLFELSGFPASPITTMFGPNQGSLSIPSVGSVSLSRIGFFLASVADPSGTGYAATSGFTDERISGAYGPSAYILNPVSGTYVSEFSGTGSLANWACVAAAFSLDSGDVGGGGEEVTGCGECPGPHLLQLIPGFSDLPDSVLTADDPAFALHLGEIAMNATFGMVRCEVFTCIQKHGDTVPLPTSCWDGYKYSREELNYIWTIQNSTDSSTNWISGPDALWFMNWNVNQTTGEVFSEEWYERSSAADTRLAAKSNDGLLTIFCIAQRQKTNLILASPATCPSIDESTIAPDKPVTQDLLQKLNQRAKFACVNTEFFDLGEYVDGKYGRASRESG
jgi:hypothetical protein